MAHLQKVYAPDGEMFEVRESLVPELVLQKGWTRSKPVPVSTPRPAKKPSKVSKPPLSGFRAKVPDEPVLKPEKDSEE
ncbi:hypothetical protein [Candidatus Macondimonas diazotrophica]|jgi:hypothetical protein|uniref:Uncharacterized protein n=1 Tax=Candidatus Macondimonas diazotrophica TaxID=2305248 RepID=A0A4Z0F5Z8_9GAMM|nr:hypothetical protein [Candidatus Macondimonas diazotrophica]TFZ81598.1 hypothetical protein E4680_11900 [Candidatus Macondimonas diazotrophica]